MMHQSVQTAPSAKALGVLATLLQARTGQEIARDRSWRADALLKPLMRERGCDTLDQLVLLLLDGSDAAIAGLVVDALLNQETSFFRDAAVFDLIAEAAAAAEAEGRGRRLRIWCAGCASGQEPLSLAMAFAERHEATGAALPEIVATDVSEAALARARAGRFTQFEIQRGLPVRRMMRWFEGGDGGDWTARPELLRAISFRRHNLVADAAPAGPFDIILCRNVLLYFSAEVKGEVFAKLAGALQPGGALVLGAGETTIGQTRAFQPSRRFRGLYEPIAAVRRSAA